MGTKFKFKEVIETSAGGKLVPLDTGRKFNVSKMFKRRPNIFYPLISKRMCIYQGVRNVRTSSERLMYVKFTSCVQRVLVMK